MTISHCRACPSCNGVSFIRVVSRTPHTLVAHSTPFLFASIQPFPNISESLPSHQTCAPPPGLHIVPLSVTTGAMPTANVKLTAAIENYLADAAGDNMAPVGADIVEKTGILIALAPFVAGSNQTSWGT